jgi:tRNA 2-thiouridine synthesizing protein A
VTDSPADRWDAGHMGCGELVMQLRERLAGLAPGELLELTARDLGAPADLPSWCRMTGHELIVAEHPSYLIKRRMEN